MIDTKPLDIINSTDTQVKLFTQFVNEIKDAKVLKFDIDYNAITAYEFFRIGEYSRAVQALCTIGYE